MKEPTETELHCPSRENSPARSPRLPKLHVKSQNPISKKASVAEESSPKSVERLRGGAVLPVKSPKSPLKSPRKPSSTKSLQTPKSPKTPVRSPRTPPFVPKDVITPVFPASPEDMAGALTSTETGLTYPYNTWGPITKYGYLDDVAPTWVQRHHFPGKHDKLAKKRIHTRRFSHLRYPAYKEIIEPEDKTCASYLDPKRKEFWRTNVLNVLNREMKSKKDQYKSVLEHLGNEKDLRKSELRRDREDRWQAFMDYDKNVKWYPGFRNNQSGVKYNIMTKAPIDEYEENRVNFENMKKRYMLAKRGLYIQERMSGARPFDIISWRQIPKCRELPEWPEDIGPPPGPRHEENMIPLNASKGALSFARPFGPFGTLPAGR